MPEDTSLDQFVGGESASERDESPSESASGSVAESGNEDGAGSEDGKPDESSSSTDPAEPTDATESALESVEPAEATYDWTPGGAVCECCDESVERRWRDDEGLVCADCKEW